MADFVDINFQEGEGMDIILEIPVGTSNPPVDILASAGEEFFTMDTVLASEGNIFIMSE